ncbi:MAG: hypothetical protein QOD56_2880 [Gammaproteobacteria bacterium]|nr:hypothetical protein [Acetobacteraceae bacterium]MEA3151941.1 hypothetical protein [Gammaproteobacteria bacterium]
MTHYPVLTLTVIGAVGCILAAAVLLAGFVWPAVVIFVATTLILCLLIANWTGRSAR